MSLDFEQLDAAAARLRAGHLVAFPTETVYGLGADALNDTAVKRIFDAKGRPSTNPLIVHVTGVDMAASLVQGELSDDAARLMRAFWPGPLSIVLPRHPRIPDAVTAGGPSVALRCPDHPIALALLFAFGGPLVGPSANKSGTVSPTTAEHVRDAFTDEQVMTLDGGNCQTGIESTVVALLNDGGAVILRPGIIGADQIEAVLNTPVGYGPGVADPGMSMPSPGMLASHYAPRAKTIIFDDWADVEELADDLVSRSSNPSPTKPPQPSLLVVLSHSLMAEEADLPATGNARLLRLPPDPREYAAALYRTLRQADTSETALIAVHRPPLPSHAETPESAAIWRAVHDRLTRATAPR